MPLKDEQVPSFRSLRSETSEDLEEKHSKTLVIIHYPDIPIYAAIFGVQFSVKPIWILGIEGFSMVFIIDFFQCERVDLDKC